MKIPKFQNLNISTGGPVNCVKYTAGCEYIMTASDNSIKLFNLNGDFIKEYKEHGKVVLGLALPSSISDNTRFASCSGDRSVFVWDVVNAKTVIRFQDHQSRVNSIDFNRDAILIASGSYDSTVKLWDCRSSSKRPIQVLDEAKDSVESVCISGCEIIAGSVDGHVRTYDVRTGQCFHDNLSAPVTCCKTTNDKKCLLVSTLDNKVRLLDRRDGQLFQTFSGHKNVEFRLESTISYTDSHALSGSEDGKVYIWDLIDGNCVRILDCHTKAVTSIAYHDSEHTMITGSLDGTAKVWV